MGEDRTDKQFGQPEIHDKTPLTTTPRCPTREAPNYVASTPKYQAVHAMSYLNMQRYPAIRIETKLVQSGTKRKNDTYQPRTYSTESRRV